MSNTQLPINPLVFNRTGKMSKNTQLHLSHISSGQQPRILIQNANSKPTLVLSTHSPGQTTELCFRDCQFSTLTFRKITHSGLIKRPFEMLGSFAIYKVMYVKNIGHLGISSLNYPDTSQIHWYKLH